MKNQHLETKLFDVKYGNRTLEEHILELTKISDNLYGFCGNWKYLVTVKCIYHYRVERCNKMVSIRKFVKNAELKNIVPHKNSLILTECQNRNAWIDKCMKMA